MSQSLPPGQGPIDPRGAYPMPPLPDPSGIPPRMPPVPGWPPPGMNYPAPMMPRPRRRWLFWALLLLLAGSIFMNLIQFVAAIGGAIKVKETTIVSGDPLSKIAVVPVDGLILDSSADQFDTVLNAVEADANVKAVVIRINTPGGSASASDEMYHRLLRFKQTMKDKGRSMPVVVSMRGMATSGGYYLACGADQLFAEPGTLTGNIGVLLPNFNISKLVQDHGIEETTLTATTTGHSYKNAGSMFQPQSEQDRQYLQGIVDGLFVQFKAAVQNGRVGKLNDAAGDIYSGKAFVAADALARGLIDHVDYPEKAYDYAAAAVGISNPSIVEFTPRTSLLDQFFAKSNLPSGQSLGINRDGSVAGMNLDSKSLANLFCAQPLMLWRSN